MYTIVSNLAAVGEDYTNHRIFHEFNTSSSQHCFNVEIINDDEIELTEDFGLTVHVLSSYVPVLIDPGKKSASVMIMDDDGTNGHIKACMLRL